MTTDDLLTIIAIYIVFNLCVCGGMADSGRMLFPTNKREREEYPAIGVLFLIACFPAALLQFLCWWKPFKSRGIR